MNEEKYLTDTQDVNNSHNLQLHNLKIYELYTLIRFLNKMFEEQLGTFAKNINLTNAQVHLMTILYFHEGLLVSEIARIGAWHISTVMSILSRLAKKKLIIYTPVEKGKGSYVFLSVAGKEHLKKGFDIQEELMNLLPFSKITNNLNQIYAVLDKYYDRPLMDQIKEHFFYAHRTIEYK